MSRMNFYFRLVALWLLLVSVLLRTTVSGYTSIYVFGDGLSTTTDSPTNPSLYFGPQQGQKRWSNGPVWTETISQLQGLTYDVAKNKSFFGHTTAELINPSLSTSVNNFPTLTPADAANSLVIVWTNNADFVTFAQNNSNWQSSSLSTWTNTIIPTAINNLTTAIDTLYAKGVRQIVMPNAVSIAAIPLCNGRPQSEKDFFRARVVQYNAQFQSATTNLMNTKPGLVIYRPDVFSYLELVIASPGSYDFTNATNGAILTPLFETSFTGPGANYLFWDFWHPTTKFHDLLADFINESIPVPDTTPPVLTLPNPAPVVEATGSSGAVVSFSVSANDAVSGSVPATAVPASGSLFPLGNSTVTVSASDAAGNLATGNFTVTVRDTTKPVLTLPNPAPIVEATGSGGAVVTFSTSANDTVSGSRPTTANPPSGSTFPLGNTTVTVSATDAAGNTATGNFTVTVRDTTPPALTLPGTLVREATGPSGAVVTFSTSASDTVSGSRPTTANPPSGSTFPLGNTTVTVSATDAAGNTATGNFTVTVRDTTPPTLTLPGTLVREATGPSGAVVTFSTSANDTVSGSRPTTANPPSGSTFPLGNTTVTVSATDAAGNPATGNFTVTVRDTTPPALTLPGTLVREATGPGGAVVTFSASASDNVSGSRPTTANPPSGSTFPVGTTNVNVSASDAAGNQASGSFKVTVVNMNGLLSNVAISPAGSGFPGIAGQIHGGPPNGQVIMQASSDLGQNDPWLDIGTIQLDATGSKAFGPIFDPGGLGLNRNFYRIKLPLSP